MKPKTMKTKKPSSTSAMRRKYEELQRREDGGSDTEKEAFWDDLTVGTNYRRFLPLPGQGEFYHEALIHFRVGPDQRTIRCIGTVDKRGFPVFDTVCPICRKFLKEQQKINATFERGSDEGRSAWRKAKDAFCPRQRYFANVLTKDGEIKVLGFGEQILKQLLDFAYSEDGPGDFFAPDNGYWIKIKREGKGKGDRRTKYVVYAGTAAELENWDEVQSELHDLDKAAGPILSSAEVKGVLVGVTYEDDEDDVDADDASQDEGFTTEEEAEEAEATPSKAKPACFGDASDYDPTDDTCQECNHRKTCKVACGSAAKSTKSRLRKAVS